MGPGARYAWLLLIACASTAADGWEPVATGVAYRHLLRDRIVIRPSGRT